MSTSTTSLYYASIAGLTGICFAVGETVLFAPCESDAIHVIREGAPLVVTAAVPPLFANFLRETIIEKRLASLGRAL
jgi:hypothetical protein